MIGNNAGKPLLLADVAHIEPRGDLATRYAWHGAPAGREGPKAGIAPAVTIAIAKKPGSNAADITTAIAERLEGLKATVIPEGIHATITRDYGYTANDKAMKLIQKLVFATLSVVLLVLFTLGWREAIVVGSAVILTLAITLFASWAMGFTINRVSLFALIFSIGILVDDAIVVVENIHRHMRLGGKSLLEAIPPAVDEVGSPTILATFTVIAALLPMAFVSGLMGPYMRPIPINASVGMLLSLAIALTVTPWLSLKLLSHHAHPAGEGGHESALSAKVRGLFERVLRPFLDPAKGGKRRRGLFLGIGIAVLAAASLAVVQLVVLKMLPFDNKSEFQVVVDLPEGTPLERTNALLLELSQALATVPEVMDIQGYAGTSAPVNFNGLVRQYYLRQGANVGDLQVNLVDKHERDRQSHEIALAVRPTLAAIGQAYGASVKVVEVPPGPPVMAPLVAEIYGPDLARAREIARDLQARFSATEGIVDVDSTVEAEAERELVLVDRDRAARLGVSQAAIAQALQLGVSGRDATYLRDGASKYPVPVRLRLPAGDQASDIDSPLYGMFDLVGQVGDTPLAGTEVEQRFLSAPIATQGFSLKWDGEWQITYETFRDMGLAYSVGLLLIYLLVVAQFRDYLVPLVIMAPIPLTVIGVMPGHALLGAQFTATSMIGMIALAGIIVRNSILLVDFINQSIAEGHALADSVVEACAVRAQPIALTGLAAMAGAFFILDDPIFNGLAIALIFGILVSTVLTLVVIPLLYFVLLNARAGKQGTHA